MADPKHIPVLLTETLDLLNLQQGMKVVDCTLGLGGHSLEILKRIVPKGKLLAFEQDEENLQRAKKNLEDFKKQVTFVHDNFENLKFKISNLKFPVPDAILFDLGLSSPHIDDPERGFSFLREGPLDMRFDRSQRLTAEKVVNTYSEEKLTSIIREYGEDHRNARRIASRICHLRKTQPFKTTHDLAHAIEELVGKSRKFNPATLTFQALRIEVNHELEALKSALHQAVEVIAPKGRISVISYHSLEDRIVKTVFRHYAKTCICPPLLPICQCNFQKKLYLLTKKPIIPAGIEVQQNPRARSARLRGCERL